MARRKIIREMGGIYASCVRSRYDATRVRLDNCGPLVFPLSGTLFKVIVLTPTLRSTPPPAGRKRWMDVFVTESRKRRRIISSMKCRVDCHWDGEGDTCRILLSGTFIRLPSIRIQVRGSASIQIIQPSVFPAVPGFRPPHSGPLCPCLFKA